MAQYGVTATPPNFTVWYAYASGGNGELTQAVDALIDRGEPLTAAQNEELYETHFGFANQAANVQKTSKEIQDSIRQVLQVLGEASDGASSYRQALQEQVERQSVVWGKCVSVRVDLGGGCIIKKKKKK